MPVMGTDVARFPARWNARSGLWPRSEHTSVGYDNARSRAGVVRLNGRLERISRYNCRPQRVECPNDQGRYRPVRDH